MPAAASHPHSADSQAEDALYYRGVLHELIDLGMSRARAVQRQGTAPASAEAADTPALHETAVAFDRIARAVRRTVALARRVAEPLQPKADAGQHRAAARRRIIREVEDVIQRKAQGAEADALHAELRERLDGPELEEEIDGRLVAEVIADICRDLGLAALPGTHPWMRRTPADVAALCARAARPCAAQPPPEAGTAPLHVMPHIVPRARGP